MTSTADLITFIASLLAVVLFAAADNVPATLYAAACAIQTLRLLYK